MQTKFGRRAIGAFAVLLFVCALGAATSRKYVFSPAGNYPGASYTVPLALNSIQIVGDYVLPGLSPLAYIQTGKTFKTVNPPGSLTSYLSGINGKGVVVGGYCTQYCNPQAGDHGFTFQNGKFTFIDFPSGPGTTTTAYGINDAGDVVGGYCPQDTTCPSGAANPPVHGFLLKNGIFTTLDYPGAIHSGASAINNAGQIVGIWDNINTLQGYLYINGVYLPIEFPGSAYTVPSAINNHGVVAGLYADQTGIIHGFTYQQGKFTTIDYPGTTATALSGINDHGIIVGVWNPPINGPYTFRGVPVHTDRTTP